MLFGSPLPGPALGISLEVVGDVDGSGHDDLWIGAYGNDEAGQTAGAAYLLLGGDL